MYTRKALDISKYFVIGPENTCGRPVSEMIHAVVDAGFTCIQIRSKEVGARELIRLCRNEGRETMGVLKIIADKAARAMEGPGDMEQLRYPVPDDLIEEFNVPYQGRDGNTLYADIYRKKETSGEKLPVLINVHGGGLFAGRTVMERPSAEAFAREGYLVFVPSYRLFREADACGEISDICAAFDFAGRELGSRGGDPDRVFVIAESAGAFLTEYAVAMKKSQKLREKIGYEASQTGIKAIAFVSGMFYTAGKDLFGRVYPPDIYGDRCRDEEFMALMDPENEEVIKNLPPSILTTSRNDFLRGYTIRYAEAMKKAGVPNRLVYYAEKNKDLVHAFVTLWPDLPESRNAMSKIDDWFRNA